MEISWGGVKRWEMGFVLSQVSDARPGAPGGGWGEKMGDGVRGFPPIRDETANGWGTAHPCEMEIRLLTEE
jgi:hypothetical protein